MHLSSIINFIFTKSRFKLFIILQLLMKKIKSTENIFYKPPAVSTLKNKSSITNIYHKMLANMKNSLVNQKKNKVKPTKTISSIIYKCGCVKPSNYHVLSNNLSTEFRLLKNKSATNIIQSSKYKSSKSLQIVNKLKISKSIQIPKVHKGHHQQKKTENDQGSNLKIIIKKLKELKSQYEALKKDHQQILDNKQQTEIIQYREIQVIKVVNKIKQVERPIQVTKKVVKKVPKEIIKYKEVQVEVPIEKQKIIYIENQPQPPLIQYRDIVKQIIKEIKVPNPENHVIYKKYSDLIYSNSILKKQIDNSQKIISDLKQQIQVKKKESSIIKTPYNLIKNQKPLFESMLSQQTQYVSSTMLESPRINNSSLIYTVNMAKSNNFGSSTSLESMNSKIIQNQTVIRTNDLINNSNRPKRKYCKKDCNQVCNCMREMVIITRKG